MYKLAIRDNDSILGRLQSFVTLAAVALAALALLEHHSGYIAIIALGYLLVVRAVERVSVSGGEKSHRWQSIDGGALQRSKESAPQQKVRVSVSDGGLSRHAHLLHK